ncbi:MAG: hypothetical protein K2O73_05750 [Lachnospiraceae bacterium]|nr:hypothetical protein [Lachnospiraceae bacterium]
MAARYKKSYANKVLNAYIEEVEGVRYRIQKDFEDMDFENASARNDMEDCVQRMLAQCDSLIQEIQGQKL